MIDEKIVSSEFDFTRLLFTNYIYATSLAFKKSLWEKVQGYDLKFPVYEDWDFLIRAARDKFIKI
ncbi:hypothetical protein JNK13_00910 [bacterium]|nr:hypothetical protein [bacterium]